MKYAFWKKVRTWRTSEDRSGSGGHLVYHGICRKCSTLSRRGGLMVEHALAEGHTITYDQFLQLPKIDTRSKLDMHLWEREHSHGKPKHRRKVSGITSG